MVAHYGCFEDVSAVIDACPSCSVSCAGCLSFEVDLLCSSQSVPLDQSYCLFIVPVNPAISIIKKKLQQDTQLQTRTSISL